VKAAALVVLVLTVTARTHITVTVLGSHVVVPVLGIVALAVVLALTAAVLWLARSLARDGLRPRVVAR